MNIAKFPIIYEVLFPGDDLSALNKNRINFYFDAVCDVHYQRELQARLVLNAMMEASFQKPMETASSLSSHLHCNAFKFNRATEVERRRIEEAGAIYIGWYTPYSLMAKLPHYPNGTPVKEIQTIANWILRLSRSFATLKQNISLSREQLTDAAELRLHEMINESIAIGTVDNIFDSRRFKLVAKDYAISIGHDEFPMVILITEDHRLEFRTSERLRDMLRAFCIGADLL